MQKQNPVIKNYILSPEVKILKEEIKRKNQNVFIIAKQQYKKKPKYPY